MTFLLLAVLIAITLAVLYHGVRRVGAEFELPFILAFIYASFVCTQAIGLYNLGDLPQQWLQSLLTVAILSLLASLAGWYGTYRERTPRAPRQYNVKIHNKTVLLFTIAAVFVRAVYWSLPLEILAQREPTGIVTIVAFLSYINHVSLVLAALVYFSRGGVYLRILLIANIAAFLPDVMIMAKRADLFFLLFALAGAVWFRRGTAVRRLYIIVGIIVGGMLMYAVGDIRRSNGLAAELVPGKYQTIGAQGAPIDFIGNLPFLSVGATQEMRNAAYAIAATNDRGVLDLGLGLWNRLVKLYVPAQVVGIEFKDALIVGGALATTALSQFDYLSSRGSTWTGFADGYASFGYFGVLVFFLNASICKRFFVLGLRGSLVSQTRYLFFSVFAIQSISHSAYALLVVLPLGLLLTAPIGRAARIAQRNLQRRESDGYLQAAQLGESR